MKIKEAFGKIGDKDDNFDIQFWQSQGEIAIFNAAMEMAFDYMTLRQGYADEPRLQRTIESFQKI
jgi:hypothetical protein